MRISDHEPFRHAPKREDGLVEQEEIVEREPTSEHAAREKRNSRELFLRTYPDRVAATAPVHQRRTPRFDRDPM